VFSCPAFDQNLSNGCRADFNHVVDLYNLEASSSLKKAHKLSPAALNAKSIEKTSVTLATSVFAESTRYALTYYADHCDRPEWRGTAEFISLVLKLWNVLNVKSSCKGKHKRDYTMHRPCTLLSKLETLLFAGIGRVSAKVGSSGQRWLYARNIPCSTTHLLGAG